MRKGERSAAGGAAPAVPPEEARALARGLHSDPHRILGPHPAGEQTIVRCFHPDAVTAELLVAGRPPVPMRNGGHGHFAALLDGPSPPDSYAFRFRFDDGSTWELADPYRFGPTLGALDLHLFREGRHRRLWRVLGACPRIHEGVEGTAFAVWAPSARRVSVVGEFCAWDGRLLPMRSLGDSGVFELFVPGLAHGTCYKFEIATADGHLRLKSDPFGKQMELPPGSASRVQGSTYSWNDDRWMTDRPSRDPHSEPVSIYEVHLGSWARVPEEGDRFLTYRELAPRLADHATRLGFTHLELMPIAEHAFYGSWGYQITGHYAPTERYGSPDDLRFFVDHCHQRGIGVLLDWVPAHFPRDDFSLRRFDGSALYEHEDPRLGEHPDWGTLIFNYGRNEVRNFLIANALYWLHEFHFDGIRIDAVASMLYRDYSRAAGTWLPNEFGGRENLEAVGFLRELNDTIREDAPGTMTIAEESTAWPGVTHATATGGLGFTFKWNMGWMHDTLAYLQQDPIHRRHHHDRLTFAMLYEYGERFVNPLSHDEVVHLKRSLLAKMPGDAWQRFANLRLLLTYQWTRPGKILLFMGVELATTAEWNHDASLDWHLLADPRHAAFFAFVEQLGALYRESPALWRGDADPRGFEWIDCTDREQSVISYLRRSGDSLQVVVLNCTPIVREGYVIGAPEAGTYRVFSTDEARFGGSGAGTLGEVSTSDATSHGRPCSFRLDLPPLGALVLTQYR